AGDEIIIENQQGIKTYYTVSNLQVVDSRNAQIPVDYDNAALTLVTCYPFNTLTPGGPLRFVVVAVKSANTTPKHLV
ncbi:MAG TPA: sortase, partial [Gammaproteobacteria bacterium]